MEAAAPAVFLMGVGLIEQVLVGQIPSEIWMGLIASSPPAVAVMIVVAWFLREQRLQREEWRNERTAERKDAKETLDQRHEVYFAQQAELNNQWKEVSDATQDVVKENTVAFTTATAVQERVAQIMDKLEMQCRRDDRENGCR